MKKSKTIINCLYCEEPLELPNWINIENYDGEVVCKKCDSRLAIKFARSSQPIKYKLVKASPWEHVD